MPDATGRLTGLTGKDVITAEGTFVGKVSDTLVDLTREGAVTHVTIDNENRDLFGDFAAGAVGVKVPFRLIRSVDDYVITEPALNELGESEDDLAV